MKQRHFKALTSLLLVVVMLASMLPAIPVTVNAAGETKTYEKVTSAPSDWSGEYLIVYEDGSVIFDGSRTTLDAVSNNQKVTISNNQITTNSDYAFTIAKSGSNYTIKSASGYYIGQSSNANGLKSSKTTTYNCTLSINQDASVNIVSGGAYLRYNPSSNSGYRFRFYKSSSYTGQKAIHLYKLVENTCDHANTTTTTNPASCTQAGSTVVTCDDCGKTISTETIPATGHTPVAGEAVAPGCTTPGMTAGSYCDVCGVELEAQEEVDALGHIDENGDFICDREACLEPLCTEHEWVDTEVTVEGNCTTDKVIAQVCAKCGQLGERTETAPGHNEDGVVEHKDASCTEDGVEGGVYCTACGEGKAAAEAVIKALGHEERTPATCQQLAVCDRCGEEYGELAAHTYGDDDKCTVCGKGMGKYVAIDDNTKLEDGASVVIVIKKDDGKQYAMINNNGTSAPTPVAVTPDNGAIAKPAETIVWTVEVNAKGYVFHPNGDTTKWLYCTNSNTGVKVGTNADNKYFVIDSASGYLKNVATNRYIGIYKTQDFRCYDKTTGNIAGQTLKFYVLTEVTECEHTNLTTVDAKEATCDEDGNELYYVCGDCEAMLNEAKEQIFAKPVIPALGHDYDLVAGECATCHAEAPVKVGDLVYFNVTTGGKTIYLNGFDSDKDIGTISEDKATALPFLLVANEDGTYSFRTTGGYLAWTGGENNSLAIKPTVTNKTNENWIATWNIALDGHGNFEITVATELETEYGVIAYNAQNPRFATYMLSNTSPRVQLEKGPTPTAPEWTGYSATLNGGVTINVEYDISAEWIVAHPDATVAFVFADGVELAGSTPVAPTAGKTTYSFTLTPQAIDKQLYFVITEGETEIARSEVSYSIYKAELDKVADQYAGLSDLLSSIDTFTATANDKTNTVKADDSINNVADWKPATTGTILNSFKLDLGQQIAVKIGVNTSIDYTGYKVTVTLGDDSLLTKADFTKYITSEGKLVVKGLAPTHLNDTLTVTVYDTEGNEAASTSFVINSYLKKLYDEDEEFKNLAAATYNYGIAAEAYAGK